MDSLPFGKISPESPETDYACSRSEGRLVMDYICLNLPPASALS